MSDSVPPESLDLAALIGSRICHDLISPLGAVGNGLELLSMAASGTGPEVALIEESVVSANARIRFFRVAFGQAVAEMRLGRPEIAGILSDVTRGGRIDVSWEVQGDLPRHEVKLAFLVLLCLETALAFGGKVTISRGRGGWKAVARHGKMRQDADLWAWLTGDGPRAEIGPAQVQFALVPAEAAAAGYPLSARLSEGEIVVEWGDAGQG